MQHPDKFTSSRVRLHGLNSEQYNGKIGTCGRWDPDKQRYEVTVDGKKMRIKSKNLKIISERCENCTFVLPPILPLSSTNSVCRHYDNGVFHRLLCCGKALCHQCDASTTTGNACVVCGRKRTGFIISGSATEVKALKKFAKKGHSWAHLRLGDYYMSGKGVKASHDKARRHYEVAAEMGVPHGMFSAGCRYMNGQGCESNPSKAQKYFEDAISQDHPIAMSNLAVMYATGLIPGEPVPMERARVLYGRAAVAGNLPAAYMYGKMCLEGQGGVVDLDSALRWLTVAAEIFPVIDCNFEALVDLGKYYYMCACPNDIPKARVMWKKAKGLFLTRGNFGKENIRRQRDTIYNFILLPLLQQTGGDGMTETDIVTDEVDEKSKTAATMQQEYTYVDRRAPEENVCGTCSGEFIFGGPNQHRVLQLPCCGSIHHSTCVGSAINDRCPCCSKRLMDDGSQKMFQQYLKLAEQGVSWAQTFVGSIYLHYLRGSPFQIPRSIALGLEWLKRAAKKGDPQALYNLGCLSLPKVPEGKGHHPVLGADAEVPASFENVHM